MVAPQHIRNAYDQFASVYARHFGPETLRVVLPIHERLLLAALPSHANVLDLCCGGGHLAAALTARGLHVTGIDNSEAMLREACANAPGAQFILADARELSLPRKFVAALSTFNSMAHIPDVDELTRVFRGVCQSLLPGAAFCFDLFMEEAYERRWRGEFRVAADGETCVVRPSYDARSRMARNEITVLDDRGSVVNAFTLFQKAHTAEELGSALARAGFVDISVYDGGRDFGLTNETGRAFFLCR